MFRYYLYILMLSFVLISCKTKPVSEQITISGQFPALTGEILRLDELEVRNAIPVDSVIIDPEGFFQLQVQMEEAGFYLLRTGHENLILLLIEKGDAPELFSEHIFFRDGYRVEGSLGSLLILDFEIFMQEQKYLLDSIAEVYYDARGTDHFRETKEELDSFYNVIVLRQKAYVEDFINQNPGSLASLIVLNRNLGQKNVLDDEEDFILFHRTDSALTIEYPGNKHVAEHSARVKEIRAGIFDRKMAEERVKTGKKAPDIVLPDTTGKLISLKSFTGKPTVICFWAGWDARSRADNRRLTTYYHDWLEGGIAMLGVSLDENAIIWRGAMKLDGLQWVQVSDLKGLNSPVATDYNLPERLPFYYLLDEKLKIVYKHHNLDSLKTVLNKIFL